MQLSNCRVSRPNISRLLPWGVGVVKSKASEKLCVLARGRGLFSDNEAFTHLANMILCGVNSQVLVLRWGGIKPLLLGAGV